MTASLTPQATLAAIPYSAGTATLNANPGITPNNNKSSAVQQWNVGVQRQLPGTDYVECRLRGIALGPLARRRILL